MPLKTNINAFRTLIDYRNYFLTTCVTYIDKDAEMSLHKVKRTADLLFPSLQPFYAEDRMVILGFVSNMVEAFDGKLLSEELQSRALRFSLTGSAQTMYTNVVYPGTHELNRLPVTWTLIV